MEEKLKPYEGDIADRLETGWTLRQIVDWLQEQGVKTSVPSLSIYMKNNYLTSTVEKGRRDVPVCAQCANYREVGTKYIRHDRKTPVRVCMACLEVIPNRVAKSPEWCSKRGEL